MIRIEILKIELAAIERLNQFYWQTENPDRNEKLKYLVRQNQRCDVISELLKLLQGNQDS